MLICHISTIHELQKQAVWQLFQAFLSGGSEYSPNFYCPLPLPGTLATMPRKHPITDGNRITVAGQADYLLQFHIVLCWAESLISSAIVLALADILSSYRFGANRPRCRNALI